MPHDPYKALYVHIPFCVSRCRYCDFHTQGISRDDGLIDQYVEGIVEQLHSWSVRGELASIETVFVGGGTPTHIGMKRLSSILYFISTHVPNISDAEWSIEANPESVTDALIRDVWALGVNRLSLGVQSFDDEVLAILGRPHDSMCALQAVESVKSRFGNFNLDLMCGIPGQSEKSLVDSLCKAIELGAPHVSVYPLAVEPHTPLYRDMMHGRFPEPEEETQARHMEIAEEILGSAGYERYEVSNYSLPGYACKHNVAYWTGIPYLGIGESAATMTQNAERRMRMVDGEVTDDLNPAQMIAEDLMMGMRMSQGISQEQLLAAEKAVPQVRECFDSLAQDGLCCLMDGRYRPTHRGWLCGNELFGRIFDLA